MGDILDIQLGHDPTTGSPVRLDIAKAPHVLVAGMTGSGKSSLVNTILTQLVSVDPELVRFVLIDPKRTELTPYASAPHAIGKPAVETRDVSRLLSWSNREMDYRFKQMEKFGYRDISSLNTSLRAHSLAQYARVLIVIDEMANLLLGKDKKVFEAEIVRIASMGRAAGLHLLLATQRPSADVITGLIRANVPTRLCLPVITKMESRIVLDEVGAETLPGPGEVLARLPGSRQLQRVSSAYVPDITISRAVTSAKAA